MKQRPRPTASRRTPVACLFAALLLYAAPALSQTFHTFAVPEAPFAGQPFELHLVARDCDSFPRDSSGDRVVELVGATLNVTVKYIAPAFGGGCTTDPATTRVITWSIEPLPAGDYTVVVLATEPEFFPDDPSELSRFPLSVLPLPRQPQASVIPAVTSVGTGMLAGLLGLLAAVRLLRR